MRVTMRVLIVDDSVVFRSQLRACLEDQVGISVVAAAANGKIALSRMEQEACDLIILDLEMPEMNGLEFLHEFRKRNFTQRVIIFAAPTIKGGAQVLEALNAGASDFVAKPQNVTSLDEALGAIRRELLPKILQFKSNVPNPHGAPAIPAASFGSKPAAASKSTFAPVLLEHFKPKIIVIGSSTGGPLALEHIFTPLAGLQIKVPILIAQHMPPHFTEALARRLGNLTGIAAAEGKAGETLEPGRIYIAPGDFHMSVKRSPKPSEEFVICLDQRPKRNNVRPAVDFLFESVAMEFGQRCAAFVLTGMGEDGKDGAIAIKETKGAVIIQDRYSSVVWGMPGSVFQAQAFDAEADLGECARLLKIMAT